jgi:hypothetical protein
VDDAQLALVYPVAVMVKL